MSEQSTSIKQQQHKDTGLTLHLKISESCVRAIVYLALALSVGSGFVLAEQAPMISPETSISSPQTR